MKKKKKVILLSDDFRSFSGVATVSKEIILQTCKDIDWVQVAALVTHPENGKYLDLSAELQKETGIEDASLKIFCSTGYGNQDLLRQLLLIEQPDAILHFTDPRQWQWLYAMEAEIREICPIIYYTIWDAEPAPLYNKPFYESCDQLLCISKLTYKLVHNVLKDSNYLPHQIKYIPHGINHTNFFPILNDTDLEYQKFRETVRRDYDFVLFYNNRNLRRKHTTDLILAFKQFCDQKDDNSKCLLLLHTEVVDENGTNLQAVITDLIGKNYNIEFTTKFFPNRYITTKELNYLYNSVDCTINVSSNEGFGLGTAESVMAGTPIIVNLTGGLQDQAGLYYPTHGEGYCTELDYLAGIDLEECVTDVWCKGILPSLKTMQGSPLTPYIWDDLVQIEDIATAIEYMYYIPAGQRKINGLIGRDAFMQSNYGLSADEMGKRIVLAINELLDNWKPIKKLDLIKL